MSTTSSLPKATGADAWLQILLLPWRRALRRGPTIGLAALLVSMLLLPSVLRDMGASRAAHQLTPALLGTAALVLWCNLVSGLMRQNQPTAARLVPGHLRRLRLVLMASWLLVSALQALVATTVFSAGLAWNLMAALLLAAVAVVVRTPVLWMLVWLLPAFAWWWLQLPLVQWASTQLRQLADHSPTTALLATLVLGLAGLPALLQGGGVAHQRSQARREAFGKTSANPDKRRASAPAFPLVAWLRHCFQALYRQWLARLSKRPESAPIARALLALGPSAHWTQQLSVLVVLACSGATILALLYAGGVLPLAGFQRKQLIGMAIGLMSFALSPLTQLASAMHTTRREQALLVLLPGMPRGAALNRALARRLLLQFGIAWALASAASLWLVGPSSSSGQVVQAIVWGTLPFGLLLWRDWSRLQAPTGGWVLLWIGLMVAAVLSLAWLGQWAGISQEQLAAGSIAVTLALGAWRWQRLRTAPAAWPTGHARRG